MVANLGCGVEAVEASLPDGGLDDLDLLLYLFILGGGFGACVIIGTGLEIVICDLGIDPREDLDFPMSNFDLKEGNFFSPRLILLRGQLMVDILSNLHSPETLGRKPVNFGIDGLKFNFGIFGIFGIGRDGIDGISRSWSSINLVMTPLAL